MNQTDGQSLSGADASPRLESDFGAQASAPRWLASGPLTSDRVRAFECHSHHGASVLQRVVRHVRPLSQGVVAPCGRAAGCPIASGDPLGARPDSAGPYNGNRASDDIKGSSRCRSSRWMSRFRTEVREVVNP